MIRTQTTASNKLSWMLRWRAESGASTRPRENGVEPPSTSLDSEFREALHNPDSRDFNGPPNIRSLRRRRAADLVRMQDSDGSGPWIRNGVEALETLCLYWRNRHPTGRSPANLSLRNEDPPFCHPATMAECQVRAGWLLGVLMSFVELADSHLGLASASNCPGKSRSAAAEVGWNPDTPKALLALAEGRATSGPRPFSPGTQPTAFW